MIQKMIAGFSDMGIIPITFFKFGASIVILALSCIYYLCEAETSLGSVGVALYYAPMLEYILAAFLMFWSGTFILDIADKELKRNSRRH